MSDYLDELISELDAYYPGSKRKRREPPAPKIKLDSTWEDDFFEKYLPNGEKVKMYAIGSLAKALNRPTKTVRFWIEDGKLPVSPYRLPSKVGKNGKEYAGRRLYTKRMVESAVELFARAGLLDSSRVDWTVHRSLSDKISEAWDKIRAEEMQTTD